MPRLLFEKKGNAVWISHLDLMRLFQRAFKRADLPLKHTQGFNPRPTVSIALPLSVGVASCCELLDFELDGETVSNEEICRRLNETLVDGIKVLSVYDTGKKLKDLAFLDCTVRMEYDAGIDETAVEEIRQLFDNPSLTVTKKSKNGPVEQDIIPMIKRVCVTAADSHTVELTALVCCQNPSLNPMQLVSAVEKFIPHRKPDHAVCVRNEIYDTKEKIFR
jgi:radical SAM-linked protein